MADRNTAAGAANAAINAAADNVDFVKDFGGAILAGRYAIRYWAQIKQVIAAGGAAGQQMMLWLANAGRKAATLVRGILKATLILLVFSFWEPYYAYSINQGGDGETFTAILTACIGLKLAAIVICSWMRYRIRNIRGLDPAVLQTLEPNEAAERMGEERSVLAGFLVALVCVYADRWATVLTAHWLHGMQGVSAPLTQILVLLGGTTKTAFVFVAVLLFWKTVTRLVGEAVRVVAKLTNLAGRVVLPILPTIRGENYDRLVGNLNFSLGSFLYEYRWMVWPVLIGVAVNEVFGLIIQHPLADLGLLIAMTGIAFGLWCLGELEIRHRDRVRQAMEEGWPVPKNSGWMQFGRFGLALLILGAIGYGGSYVYAVTLMPSAQRFIQDVGDGAHVAGGSVVSSFGRVSADRVGITPLLPLPEPAAPPAAEPAPAAAETQHASRNTHHRAATVANSDMDCAAMSAAERSLVNDVAQRNGQRPPCN